MSKASEARRNALYQRVLGEGRVRVGELARQLAGDAANDAEVVLRLAQYLSANTT